MIFDSHTHSRFSADSKAEPRDMMEAALKKGLAGLCVTDHYDCDEIPAFCTLENLRGAKAALEPLRQEYAGRLEVLRGVELAQGGTLDGYRERTHMVVEGALACKTLKTLSEAYNVELPITDVVRGVVWEGADPKAAAKDLFARPLTTEFYGL